MDDFAGTGGITILPGFFAAIVGVSMPVHLLFGNKVRVSFDGGLSFGLGAGVTLLGTMWGYWE